jgi:hypothetical protein
VCAIPGYGAVESPVAEEFASAQTINGPPPAEYEISASTFAPSLEISVNVIETLSDAGLAGVSTVTRGETKSWKLGPLIFAQDTTAKQETITAVIIIAPVFNQNLLQLPDSFTTERRNEKHGTR